jgi:hypothetical protein
MQYVNYMSYVVSDLCIYCFQLYELYGHIWIGQFEFEFFDRKRVVGAAGNANRPYKKLNSGGW